MSRSLREVVAAVLALAVGLALGVYLFNRSSGDDWKTLKDDTSGVTLSHPREWAVQTFGPYCRRVGPGLLVSNVGAHTFRNTEIPNGCTNEWNLGGLPKTFVLVDVSLFAVPAFRVREEPDTELPLDLTRFVQPPAQRPERGYSSFARIVRGRFEYSVRLWTGSVPSPSDAKALARLIGSIRVSDPQA
jgi:hypothetical protein